MSEWKTYRINEVADVIMGQSPSSASYNEAGVGYPFLQGCADFDKRTPVVRYYCTDPKKRVPNNSILISVRAPVGTTNRADAEYCIGRGLAGIVGRNINQDLLHFKIIHHIPDLERVSQGSTFLAINTNDLNNLLINIPTSLAEQRKIALILSTVDAVIEKSEAAIAKYKVIKAGMMHDLFTRGINRATGRLRLSQKEAPWLYKETELGWVPKEWEVISWKDACENVFVGIATSTTKYFTDVGVPLIRNQNILENKIDIRDLLHITQDFAQTNHNKAIKAGDILSIRTGYPGQSAVALSTHNGFQSFTTLISRPKSDKDTKYLCYLLNSQIGKRQIANLQGGGAQQNLNVGWLVRLKVLIPNITEQNNIASQLDAIESQIDKEAQVLEKNISLKQALMSDLLKGKVRVQYDEEIAEAV